MAPQPTKEDGFSFGPRTARRRGRDRVGDAARPALDPAESVHRGAERGCRVVRLNELALDHVSGTRS